MIRNRLITLLLVLAILSCLALLFAIVFPKIADLKPGARIANTPTLLRQVQGLNELITIKYVLEKVVILEDVKWFGENKVLMVARGTVKAGIDLSQMKEEDIEVNGNKLVITLPPSKMTDVYLDENATKVIERTTGLLRSFDKDLEQNARRQAVEDLRRGAKYGGILQEADERARTQLRLLFLMLGFSEVEFRSSHDSP